MSASVTAPFPTTPADLLIQHLGLAKRTAAEVRDLYSRPIPSPVLPAVPLAA